MWRKGCDESGEPTAIWNNYKDRDNSKAVMASAITQAYNELFSIYSDADKRDKATIHNYFASKWGLSTRVADQTEQTFKHLCSLADFSTTYKPPEKPDSPPSEPEPIKIEKNIKDISNLKPITININLQLQLPATEDSNIYDALFASLKRNLLD